MSGEPRPLLALGSPEVGSRFTQPGRDLPVLRKPGARRQGERLTPQFRELASAFDSKRVVLSSGAVEEMDPELVVVFDLAGTVENFRSAVNRIEGLEFLSEYLDDDLDSDDDFYMSSRNDDRTDSAIRHSLYAVMSNAQAISQLIGLFDRWKTNPTMEFDHGLAKFRAVFDQLREIRRWGPRDRIRETGLLEAWQERLEVVGESFSSVLVEIELWYRRSDNLRRLAEDRVRETVRSSGGEFRNSVHIQEISYHALLVELPVQQVEAVVRDGAGSISLLDANEIMFVNPYMPMTVDSPEAEVMEGPVLKTTGIASGQPRVALLDGLPFMNHDLLKGRLSVDDPDNLGADYPVAARKHGTAMASLIMHGDLSKPGKPMERPLYVRPILRPHEYNLNFEQVVSNQLLTDLLHQAIRRIVVGENGRSAVAPSVRIVNLSIGAESRAMVRRVSPVGRLIDWLAFEYNLLFVISAGNHRFPLTISVSAMSDSSLAKGGVLRAAKMTSRLRGILPPGDALNALTIGAIHADESGDLDLPDTVWDAVGEGMPTLYGAVGPGVGRSIKPELYHNGGRTVYVRPVIEFGSDDFDLLPASASELGPGTLVAAPGRGGTTSGVSFTHGTSNATALVTREANQLFDILEAGRDDESDFPFPDPLFHPVLAKALLVHASSWGDRGEVLRRELGLDSRTYRRELTTLLGYGALDVSRLGQGAENRAVLLGGGLIGRDQRHTYNVPLPISLRSRSEWHRFTVTLAYMAPTVGHLTRYRGAKVYFEKLDDNETGAKRIEAEYQAVRRGSCQQEIIEGSRAMVFDTDGSLPIHVQCMDDAQRLPAGKTIRYGLVVSIETAMTTSSTIHDEIRIGLQAQARDVVSARVRP